MCECDGLSPQASPQTAESVLGDQFGVIREKLAMCQVCPAASRGPSVTSRRSAIDCTIHGMSVVAVSAGCASCPRGLHPDSDGIVRWLGVRWNRVPMPIRVWLRFRAPSKPPVSSWDGCGCVTRLKALAQRFGAYIRA